MSKKDDSIMVTGKVVESRSNSLFLVEITTENGNILPDILCTISGKIRMMNIHILPGDMVQVAMSPYSVSNTKGVSGRIEYRMKDKNDFQNTEKTRFKGNKKRK